MVYTFYELQQQVLQRLDEVGQTTTTANVKLYLNNAHTRRCNQHPWQWMVTTPTTVTTRAGAREVVLKHNLQRLLEIRNQSTGKPLGEVTQRQYADLGSSWHNLSGSARRYVRWGLSPVSRQPSAATALRLVSDDAADTGSTYNV